MDRKVIEKFLKAYKIYNENLENKDILYIYKENNCSNMETLKGLNIKFMKKK